MDTLRFTLGARNRSGEVVCQGGNDAGNAVTLCGSQQGTPDMTLSVVASEILRRGLVYQTSDAELAFEYATVTDRQIPILYCYRRDAVNAPVVFFNHGTTGQALDQLFMGIPLAQAGFFTVLLDAWYHGRRKPNNWTELFSGTNYKETYVDMLLRTCEDISHLLDHLANDPRADVERAGITGISQGGFMSFMAITKDCRFKAAAPMIGSPDLEDMFGSSRPLEEHRQEVIDLVIRHSPLHNCERMPPTALLVQNGAMDTVVPVTGTRKLDARLRDLYRDMPERYCYIEYPSNAHSDAGMREPTIKWLQQHLLAR